MKFGTEEVIRGAMISGAAVSGAVLIIIIVGGGLGL